MLLDLPITEDIDLLYRSECEEREKDKPLKSGRLRVYASRSCDYVFDGNEWFVRVSYKRGRGIYAPCASVPQTGLWVSGHIDRSALANVA